jgi:hypothetical protein
LIGRASPAWFILSGIVHMQANLQWSMPLKTRTLDLRQAFQIFVTPTGNPL